MAGVMEGAAGMVFSGYVSSPSKTVRVSGVSDNNSLTTDLIQACSFTELANNSLKDWTTNRNDFANLWELPSPTVGPDHGSHQGYTYETLNDKHITIATTALKLHADDATWTVEITNSSPFTSLTGSPTHLGDAQYYDGLIYVPVLRYVNCAAYDTQSIVTYNATTLAFVAEYVISAQSDNAISGLGIDEANGVIYVANFCDGTFLDKYSLSAPATYLGRLTLNTETINAGPQSCYYKSDNTIWVGHSSKLINVYNNSGDLVNVYQHSQPGDPQGIDYSQANSLRQTVDDSSGTGEYNVCDFDMSTEPGNPVLDGASVFVDKTKDKQLAAIFQMPEQGTIVCRVKFKSAYNYNVLWDQVDNPDDFECWVDSGGTLRARANNNTISFGAVNNDQWYDVAYTWNDNGSNTLSEAFLNSVSINSNATAPVFSLGNYFFLGGGHVSNPVGDLNYEYFFMFDAVKTVTDIAAIHSKPNDMFTFV